MPMSADEIQTVKDLMEFEARRKAPPAARLASHTAGAIPLIRDQSARRGATYNN